MPKESNNKIKDNNQNESGSFTGKVITYTTFTFIFSTFGLSLLLLANYFFFTEKFAMNTRVGDVNISGLTYSEAKALVEDNLLNYFEQPILLDINSSREEVYAADIDLTFDVQTAMQEALPEFSMETPKAFFQLAFNHFRNHNVALPVEYNEDMLAGIVYDSGSIERLQEPDLEFVEDQFVVVPGVEGDAITEASMTGLNIHLSLLQRYPLILHSESQTPVVSDADAQAVADLANEIVQKELILRAGNIQVQEKIGENPEWLEFELNENDEQSELALHAFPIYATFGSGLVAGEATGPTYEILLDQEAIESFITQAVISQMSNHAENITLSLDANGEIVVDGFLKDGYALDTENAAKLIVENFNSGIFENELPVSVQAGKIIDNTGMDLGITTTLAVGESDFGHSDANRINNVKVGLSRFQNVLIPPGGVFNYADYIGPIDAAHGFLPGWVIKNRTQNVLEYGGGICQTSTTLFRAAFYAGLPIIERHPHSYDVSYYRWPEVGMDASVYVPYASLKFENDTPGYILIQQAVNTATTRAYVWIYGTDDGRQVNITGPSIYGKYWASSSIEVPSANVAAGQRVLSHGAVAGFQSDWWRTVTYTDGREEGYTVHSSYTAVPATYLVGQ